MESNQFSSGTTLVICHPGHELRVLGWLAHVKPTVFVLTDGSGSTMQSRLPSTTRLIEESQSSIGSIYGRFTDRELYDAILNHRHDVFVQLAREMAAEFERLDCHTVVCDAIEGYNPGHDICGYTVDAAIALAHIIYHCQ